MVRGIYSSAAGMQVQSMLQDAIANNLANADTTGFKSSVMAFSADHWGAMGRLNDRFVKTPMGLQDTRPVIGFLRGGALLALQTENFVEGPIRITGNPLDVALREPQINPTSVPGSPLAPGENPGHYVHMFALADKKTGERSYTRAGEFSLDSEGYLVTKDNNYYVLVRDPITGQDRPTKIMMRRPDDPNDQLSTYAFNPDDTHGTDANGDFVHLAGDVRIDDAGFISIEDHDSVVSTSDQAQYRPVGYLAIYRLPVDGLVQKGNNTFALTNDPLDPRDPASKPQAVEVTLQGCPQGPSIRAGALEGSNVSTVKEMVAMLAANRIYEMNARVMHAQDQELQRAVTDVGRSVR